MQEDKHEAIMELAKRRGFFWQSYEIYGGVAGFYDLGPLGVRLKEKIISLWREFFVKKHAHIVVEIETPIIAPARVFEASGHLEHFTDPIVECLKCGRKFRADHLIEEKLGIKAEGLSIEEMTKIIREHDLRCPVCGGPLSDVKLFNLLFKTTIGPYSSNTGYLRPETAQGMFVSFKRVYEVSRKKLPLGIAQIGRVARNEISPRQGMLRLREFTIAEIEFFFDPEEPVSDDMFHELLDQLPRRKIRILTVEAKKRGEEKPFEIDIEEAIRERLILTPWLGYWMAVAQEYMHALGIDYDEMYFDEKAPEERAHYSAQTFDQLVRVSRYGWIEVSGHSYRTDYDLSRHMKYSGEDLRVFKQYKEPLVVKKKHLLWDKAWIGRTYRSRAREIFEALSRMNPEEVLKQLEEKGYLEIAGAKIPKDRIKVIEREEKITGKRFIPHVAEPSFGVERILYAVLDHAYAVKDGRVVLKLPRLVAPIDVAVFPLVKDENIIRVARKIWLSLMNNGFYTIYDEEDSIGRRYARVDEIGVPAAITIDYQSLEDNTVTLRDRDTWEQVRIHIDNVVDVVRDFLRGASLDDIRHKYG